ncbi:MAG TPA: tRNA (N(6)-L-threonylcarbamoyladenosine(37)-C(2))-methylthiotransferase MtaB [Bacillota bacterium]|nr:tRNA (N(6)-L-threonylcarbamoyladenosine(37)-C(2))-methylthiotransferase MtaB [Bacillota bacterium]
MKVAFYTLGCKVNQNDTQGLAALFLNKGYEVVPFEAGAAVYVINTCCVTRTGEQKSAQMIRKAGGLNPEALIVVTGCYAQTAPGEVAGIPGVHLVVGMGERSRIVELVEEYYRNRRDQVVVGAMAEAPFWSSVDAGITERTRATLKIEDGCDQFCSYCIVPFARGPVRSMPPDQVIHEISRLVGAGFREIVLTGIHLGAYGQDIQISLADLLPRLVAIQGDFRIRLGSLEPTDFTEELMGAIFGQPKICPYLHIPLQNGSDRILRLMNRRYGAEEYGRLLARIRERDPLIAVGTDLIVGFPGETVADFEETTAFMKQQAFSRVHVFRYSPRRGTQAAEFPERVPKRIQEERSKIIQQIAAQTGETYARKLVGGLVEALFETKVKSEWSGLTGEYLRVKIQSELDLKNCLREVSVEGYTGEYLQGSLVFP